MVWWLPLFACAQDATLSCGTATPEADWEHEFQRLIAAFKQQDQNRLSPTTSYTIPIIFHIVHGGEPLGTFPNLAQGQIDAQLIVLNQDLNALAYNRSNYPALAFVNWASDQGLSSDHLDASGRVKIADFNIQFCLATLDPDGNALPEPGIDRLDYRSMAWPAPTLYGTQTTMKNYLDRIVKPGSIWDVTRYLNVWITDKSPALTFGGVSSVPPLSGLTGIPNTATDSTDGIWCYAKVTGAYRLFPGGTYISPLIDGRTLTHEVGHYLGLRHIWGDTNCGSDFCGDTPPAASENTGVPSYPANAGSCSSPSNSPDGEMFMNFMDYTMGSSKYMFTTDQMIRAQTAMKNSPFRKQLGTHGVCTTVSTVRDWGKRSVSFVFPNPASAAVRINLPEYAIQNVQIRTSTGVLLQIQDAANVSIENLPEGLYIVVAQTDKGIFVDKLIKQ